MLRAVVMLHDRQGEPLGMADVSLQAIKGRCYAVGGLLVKPFRAGRVTGATVTVPDLDLTFPFQARGGWDFDVSPTATVTLTPEDYLVEFNHQRPPEAL